jgi:hypothetical protein
MWNVSYDDAALIPQPHKRCSAQLGLLTASGQPPLELSMGPAAPTRMAGAAS